MSKHDKTTATATTFTGLSPEKRAQFAALIDANHKKEERVKVWAKGKDAGDFSGNRGFAIKAAEVFAAVGLIHPDDKAAFAGVFYFLSAGNQSQVRQMHEGKADEGTSKPKVSAADAFGI